MYPLLSPLVWNNASRPYCSSPYTCRKPDVLKDKHKIYLDSFTAYSHKRWIKSSKFKFKRKATAKTKMRKPKVFSALRHMSCSEIPRSSPHDFPFFSNAFTMMIPSPSPFCFLAGEKTPGWCSDSLFFIASLNFLFALHTLRNSSLSHCGHINR